MIKLKTVFLSFIILTVNLSAFTQGKISFIEEYIDFELDSTYFSINGLYSFYNPTDKEINQPIIFPFAVETNQIDSIRITNLNDFSKVKVHRLEKSISFFVNMLPLDTTVVNIFYRQKTAKNNTYIITSTQTWKQPLKKAVYTLTTSLFIDENYFSYPFVSKEIANEKSIFRWEEKDFMPDREFEIVIKE